MNFNAGPAALPGEALERTQRELLDHAGTGMSIVEHSHRGKAYEAVHQEALALLRRLLPVPDSHDVLLLQGGASQQFAAVPMNLLPAGRSADYVVTGQWGKKALAEAKTVGTVRVSATTEVDGKFARVPSAREIAADPAAAYVHITTNETIAGVQWPSLPDTGGVPLVADASSDILARALDVSRLGLLYAGAQKNLGPSGLTVVVVRKDLVEGGRTDIPKIFQYRTHAAEGSLYNTPPTLAVALMRNVLDLVASSGGLAAVELRNREKAALLYDVIDARPDLFRCPVEPASRSIMNVVFTLPTPELEAEFLAGTQKAGMVGLKGHRSVGGVRASLYNAVELEWVRALAGYMKAFRS